ncbi:A24 family peptidase C-terminal domain-containing protein [Candidatus Nitrosotalea okcheonensis]|uniref:Putative archaeal preflagellin peptidase, FlaK n=1 Tax=Candidatus Nitrosotalea okcheonensis TaxID=1903276 RepID=A0A2H1FDH6_9ARCH|nr:A24 family peptidase C-terminal domain-containing protein [Candidatus Nitrosotalea okcheonensis]SMH70814.1 putative archaeal preflagellin peptidase, FlaK [Candidatus Nitrosotalea okcheonensis]
MPLDVTDIRVIMALLMLGIASYTDIKKREIDDKIWMIFGGLAVFLLFFTPNIFNSLTTVGFSLIIVPIAIFVWRIGFFGGADAFALIVLAALAPESTFSISQVNPFTTLLNTVLLSIIPVIANITRNIISILRHEDIFKGFENDTRKNKIIAMFIGHRSKNPKFSFSIEKREGGMRKLDFALKNADNGEFCSSPDTWVTPGIPYMIYILGGFIIQLVYGDVIINIIKTFY